MQNLHNARSLTGFAKRSSLGDSFPRAVFGNQGRRTSARPRSSFKSFITGVLAIRLLWSSSHISALSDEYRLGTIAPDPPSVPELKKFLADCQVTISSKLRFWLELALAKKESPARTCSVHV